MTAAMDFVLEEIDLGFARFSAARKADRFPAWDRLERDAL